LFSENTAALSRMFLAVPLSLLAARTIIELATRRLSSRALIGLAPATALLLLWWWLPELRAAFEGMLHRRSFSPGMSLALHLGLDLVVLMALAIHVFNGWASANDQRRRYLIGAFLLGVLCMTIAPGLREVSFRHRETTDVLSLREAIVQRQARRPLDLLAVVSTDDDPTAASDTRQGPMPQPGGRLRFILRSAVPHLTQIDVATVQQLQDLPENERVVVLAGTGLRLSYTMQSRLRLEVLYPGNSGLLAAYSTPVEPPRRVARR
jgi:hypothetical protein